MAFVVTTNNFSFSVSAHENLLEALERTGHDIEYQCRSGYCGACRTTLISGQIAYQDTPLAFIAPGEILPCCCYATSNLTLNATQTDTADPEKQPDLFK